MIRNLWEEAENSRAATSRVAALRELRKIFESKKPEPEPPVGNPRVHDLAAVLKLAEEAGVDVAAGSRPRVPPPRLSAGYAEALLFDEHADGRHDGNPEPDEISKSATVSDLEPEPEAVVASVEEAPSGPSGPAIYDDFGRWALIVDGEAAADLRRQEFEAAQREGERLMGGWRDPDKTSGELDGAA